MSFDSPACVELRAGLPTGWCVVPLESVTDFQEGPGILAKDFHDIGIPLLRLRNIETPVVQLSGCNFLDPDKVAKKWRHFALQVGDLLISTSASLGRVSVVGPSAVGSIAYTGIIRFRSSSPKLDHKYLRAFLSSAAFVKQAEQMATGSVIKHFGPSHLRQMAVVLPTVDEQVQIAAYFDVLDERIALLRETNATLEAIAQALFKSWFVDFDPVRAKQQGLAPEGMDAATAGLFPLTPGPWGQRKIADLEASADLQIGDGYRAKNDELGLPGVPFVRAGDLDAGRLTPTKDHLKSGAGSKTKDKTAKVGDTVFTSKGTIGRFAFVGLNAVGAVYSPQVCFWRSLNVSAITPEYLHFWMRSERFETQVNAVRGQAAIMDFVSLTNQRDMSIDLPPIQLQQLFREIAGPLLSRIEANREMVDSITDIRDTLLPRLISGQLRLPEAEAMVSELA